MAKYTVDRKTWYRGMRGLRSRLLRPDGTRCCIGFVGQQCGISDNWLLDRPAIADETPEVIEAEWPEWMKVEHLVEQAYEANDNPDLTGEQREAKLKEIFARNGDEIEFEN
jgi:hypothetical protein